MWLHVATIAGLLIDIPLIFYNGYLYGKRVQMREDKKLFDEARSDLVLRVDDILRRHAIDPNRPSYMDRQ